MKKTVNCQLSIVNCHPGFTLVEIILYMTLVSIFILVLTDIFAAILNVRTESEATSSVEQDARFILARFAYDINRASAIPTPANLGDSNPTLTFTAGSTYTYAISGIDLQLNGTSLNSSETKVSSLSFKKMGNSGSGNKETISIQFTLTSKTQRPSGPQTKTFNTTIGRR